MDIKIEKLISELETWEVIGLAKRDPLWVQGWNDCLKAIEKYLKERLDV